MRAALLREDLHRLHIEDVAVATPGPHEVLIETAASGLCHSDLHFIDGHLPGRFPMLLGHEASGVVAAIGERVADVAVGDHVITCLSGYCGRCDKCLRGKIYLCRNRAAIMTRDDRDAPRLTLADGTTVVQSGLGAFAEQMLVHENTVAKIPDEMPLTPAAIIGCAVMTGLGGVIHSAAVEAGSTVAVIGCGGIGMSTVHGASVIGAARIIAIDTNPEKLRMARTLGATDLVDPADGDVVAQVKELTRYGVDYSFECIGTKATVEQSYAMLDAGGLCTVFGVTELGDKIEISGHSLILSSKRLQGSYMGSNRFKVDMPYICQLYLTGRLKLDAMVSRTIALDQIDEGFEAMRQSAAVRTVIEF